MQRPSSSAPNRTRTKLIPVDFRRDALRCPHTGPNRPWAGRLCWECVLDCHREQLRDALPGRWAR